MSDAETILQRKIQMLEDAAEALIHIVDKKGTKWHHEGFYLKDTPQWFDFYIAWRKSKENNQ